MGKILIIDDEEKLRSLMARIITLEGFEVLQAQDCKSGLKKLTPDIDVVLCDVKLPDGNGVELVTALKEKWPAVEVILLTAYGNIPDGVQAIKNGAFDYIVKGDDNNKIIPLIHRAIEKGNLSKQVASLEARLDKKYSFEGILGTSKAIREAVSLAERVSPTDATVLLTGETGTGKEVFANAIHQNSPRRSKNFVAINCSAFSHDLLESEMFGHIAGAFTGAMKDKKGLFEEANGGTIFLDELGEMALDLQAKLLRVLENGEFIKVGESKVTKVNVRVIAATNRNLLKEIEEGHFRQDLYYRLSIFEINLPSLRQRTTDIETLASFFIKTFNAKTGSKITGMENAYLQMLKLHPWPGNIRELKNVIERSVILETGNTLNINTLPFDMRSAEEATPTDKTLSAFSLAAAEKIQIQKVLNYTGGNKAEAARLLVIGIATLYRKIEEYAIKS
ncbi:chemotaxis protein CheY [Flavobacterium akiainvivens]|uniref:Chemotaxis protein CheY n=1 Tax=Flavobacterium akiainvivens TaxID=1202724 RepID=A0A0M9VJ41_9FLAO|nr:sigma-54 dependent transcriptional regulator [Flavobacterium akiainvivens]KOS07319.1 chemotaxis protein CheY [Flavobacterium akiainvivens]SFQ46636.1 DNA-binding transcriptional response regulator, NtrC family, contains REC, AAA-type ATPase, and a Fis-type DNA-binding domains [Flavobacterium akiainvivens]